MIACVSTLLRARVSVGSDDAGQAPGGQGRWLGAAWQVCAVVRTMMSGPTLSPVASLCFACAPLHSGKVPDFQQRHITAFFPFISDTLTEVTTFGSCLSMFSFMTPAIMMLLPHPTAGCIATCRPLATAAAQRRPKNFIGRESLFFSSPISVNNTTLGR